MDMRHLTNVHPGAGARVWSRPQDLTCSGLSLREVWANSSSSFSDIDSIDFEAPLSSDFGVSPLLADRAAPAAFCWAADLAGMTQTPFVQEQTGPGRQGSRFSGGDHRTQEDLVIGDLDGDRPGDIQFQT